MGLDISYCRKATKVREPGEDYDYETEALVYVNPAFAERADGLEDGIYEVGDGDDFRAGSYGGYNAWREELAALVGYTPEDAWEGRAEGKPFVELVNFSDCEGVIGPKTSAKLAQDFAAFQEKVGERGVFAEKYALWRKAFETAADGGFVNFH